MIYIDIIGPLIDPSNILQHDISNISSYYHTIKGVQILPAIQKIPLYYSYGYRFTSDLWDKLKEEDYILDYISFIAIESSTTDEIRHNMYTPNNPIITLVKNEEEKLRLIKEPGNILIDDYTFLTIDPSIRHRLFVYVEPYNKKYYNYTEPDIYDNPIGDAEHAMKFIKRYINKEIR